jgi:hypothetical protein
VAAGAAALRTGVGVRRDGVRDDGGGGPFGIAVIARISPNGVGAAGRLPARRVLGLNAPRQGA